MDIEHALSGYEVKPVYDIVPSGAIRIMTDLLYPDGHNIDVFISWGPEYRISDYGGAVSYLEDMSMVPGYISDEVDFDGWQLYLENITAEILPYAVQKIAKESLIVVQHGVKGNQDGH